MKALAHLLSLLTLAQAAQDSGEYVEQCDVFGQLDEDAVAELRASRIRRERARKAIETDLAVSRSDEVCNFPVDVHILQDATGSFMNDFVVAAEETIPRLGALFYHHPGSTISLSYYRDKPILDLGELNDFCFENDVLRTQNLEALSASYKRAISSGGRDWAENQYGALVQTLQSPNTVPWATNPDATKLVILITDAGPHYEGDNDQVKYPDLKPFESPYDETRAAEYCTEMYYPSPDEVATVLENSGVYLGIIMARPENNYSLGWRAWQWFNGYIGQSDAFLTQSNGTVAGWTDQLLELITQTRKAECGNETEPLPPTPELCEEPEDEGCDNCLENGGCCEMLTRPKIAIAHYAPPATLDLNITFPSQA